MQMSFTGEGGLDHTVCVCPLMLAANHSTGMEKRQISLSKDTPESPVHLMRH